MWDLIYYFIYNRVDDVMKNYELFVNKDLQKEDCQIKNRIPRRKLTFRINIQHLMGIELLGEI